VLAVSDSQVIGTKIEASLLVIDTKRTTRKMARVAVEALDQVNARIIGIAVNRVDARARGYYYEYYDYYEGDEGDDAEGPGDKAKRKWALPWRRRLQPTNRVGEQQVYAAKPRPQAE
jgi:Mrp family chromosome partitioning ATPase